MKTPKPERQKAPALCYHKGRGLYYVRLNRRTHYLGADAAEAKNRYRTAIAEWLARGCQAPPPPPDDLRISELCKRYLVHCEEYYAASPLNIDRVELCLKPLLKLYPYLPAVEFTPQKLKALRQTLMENKVTRRYLNEKVQGIRRMFKWAVSEGLLPVEVFQALATVEGLRKGFTTAPEGKKRKPITDEELEAVRAYLPAPVMAALEVMSLSGARPSEILNLRPQDIDRSGDVWRVALVDHKTAYLGKDRTLRFGSRAQRVLTPFLLRPPDAFLFSPAESYQQTLDKRKAARVTPLSCGNIPGSNRTNTPKTEPGDRYDRTSFRRCITRAIDKINRERKKQNADPERADLPKLPLLRQFCPYEARHGAATRIRAAAGLDAAAAVLGHAKISMSEHYAMIDDELAAEVMRRIG